MEFLSRSYYSFLLQNKVLLSQVNSNQQKSLTKRFNICFYPSIHFILYQQVYRLKYNVHPCEDAIFKKIRTLLSYDPIRLANDYSDYEQIEVNEAAIIAYSKGEFSVQDQLYEKFRRCAIHLNQFATFYWAYGELADDILSMMDQCSFVITYKPPGSIPMESLHLGLKLNNLLTVDSFIQWAVNQELPFFHHHTVDDPLIFKSSFDSKLLLLLYYENTSSLGTFYELLKKELSIDQWMGLFLVVADATTTPITELDRLQHSMPLVAFFQDADQIFYPYNGSFEQLQVSGQLKSFLGDYYSGELQKRKEETEKRIKEKVPTKNDEPEEKSFTLGLFC